VRKGDAAKRERGEKMFDGGGHADWMPRLWVGFEGMGK
jgi:hypothetical protein